MSPSFDRPKWRLSILMASPYFKGVAEEKLAKLALAMRLRTWPREHIFNDRRHAGYAMRSSPYEDRPLSMIASGKVALVQRFTTASSRRLLGPGDMFGLESVHAWLFPRLKDSAQFIASTVDETWCLELQPHDFAAVLGDDMAAEPLRSILSAWSISVAYPTAFSSLAATQQLSCMRQDQLQALITRSAVMNVGPGAPLPGISMGEKPTAVYVLLEGRLDRLSVPIDPSQSVVDDSAIGQLDPGQIVGLNELFDDRPMSYSVVSRDARVFCISKDVFLEAPSQIPSFLRGVTQAIGETPLYAPMLLTPNGRLLSSAVVAVVPALPRRTLQVISAVDHLAEYIASTFREDVLVVRVYRTPRPSGPVAFVEWENPSHVPSGNIQRVDTSLAEFNEAWLSQWVTSCWDVVLIEPIGLDPVNEPGDPFLEALAQLNVPVTSSVLLERPQDWDGVAVWMPQILLRWALPTAVLSKTHGMGLPEAWSLSDGGGILSQAASRALSIVDGVLTGAQQRYQQQMAELGPERTCDGVIWPTWPVATARILLPRPAFEALTDAPVPPEIQEAIGRWARAITRRRVGVAIGGAGAISFIGSAMLRGLHARGVPVDMVSGTSFGAVVAAFYSAEGLEGLKRLARPETWVPLYGALTFSPYTTYPLALWADCKLDFANLNDLNVGLFAVATLAENQSEWPLRSGTVGNAVRSSGSLPPFAPTVHGRLRLIDGGYSADVPTQVLSDEGADLIIAVNPYAYPAAMPRAKFWIPFVSSFITEQNPFLRAFDWTRGYQMLWRFAAQSQFGYADVVYNNDDPNTLPVAFYNGKGIARKARKSDALKTALDEAVAAWTALLSDPDVFLVATETRAEIVVTVPVVFERSLGFTGTTPAVQHVLTQASIDVVRRAAGTFLSHAPITGRLLIHIEATGEGSALADTALAEQRGEKIKQLLVYAGLPEDKLDVQAASGTSEMVVMRLRRT